VQENSTPKPLSQLERLHALEFSPSLDLMLIPSSLDQVEVQVAFVPEEYWGSRFLLLEDSLNWEIRILLPVEHWRKCNLGGRAEGGLLPVLKPWKRFWVVLSVSRASSVPVTLAAVFRFLSESAQASLQMHGVLGLRLNRSLKSSVGWLSVEIEPLKPSSECFLAEELLVDFRFLVGPPERFRLILPVRSWLSSDEVVDAA
jgi:hypothetical protein